MTTRLASATLLHGDCIEVMRSLPDNSVDSIVTDPPYGLGFMGKAWDDLPPGLDWARECLRVLKPGGHLLAFGGTRTWHRLAVAVEDAGFEIRDSIAWLYGSGFPKSLDVSKAIDKQQGTDGTWFPHPTYANRNGSGEGGSTFGQVAGRSGTRHVYAPGGDEARRWEGWGTALKPAFEPCVVARKPLAAKTVAANVLAHGTGALHIDACRIGTEGGTTRSGQAAYPLNEDGTEDRSGSWARTGHSVATINAGRWPSNVILDETTAPLIDDQSGFSKSAKANGPKGTRPRGMGETGERKGDPRPNGDTYDDQGGASRFFYVAKAPKRERPVITHEDGTRTAHPTVKPLTLMRHLVRLVTPEGGTVLEPFAGSGATVEAALLEGFDVIAIERETDYLPLIEQRIARVQEVAA